MTAAISKFVEEKMQPGEGYLFVRANRPDTREGEQPGHRVLMLSGHVMLHDRTRVHLSAVASSRAGKYEITVKAFPKDEGDQTPENQWKTVGHGALPLLGDNAYSDGQVIIHGRPYIARLIKRASDRDGLRFDLPQVRKGARNNQQVL